MKEVKKSVVEFENEVKESIRKLRDRHPDIAFEITVLPIEGAGYGNTGFVILGHSVTTRTLIKSAHIA